MSYTSSMPFMDQIPTAEDIQLYDDAWLFRIQRNAELNDEMYVANHIRKYLFLETPEACNTFRSQLNDSLPVHQKILKIINTFDSAKTPEKKKRGRPRKNQG